MLTNRSSLSFVTLLRVGRCFSGNGHGKRRGQGIMRGPARAPQQQCQFEIGVSEDWTIVRCAEQRATTRKRHRSGGMGGSRSTWVKWEVRAAGAGRVPHTHDRRVGVKMLCDSQRWTRTQTHLRTQSARTRDNRANCCSKQYIVAIVNCAVIIISARYGHLTSVSAYRVQVTAVRQGALYLTVLVTSIVVHSCNKRRIVR